MINNQKNVKAETVTNPDAKNAKMKVLIGEQEGWQDYVMRIIELEAYGHSPQHIHDWPHINYVLEGEGTLFIDGDVEEISVGSYSYVPAGLLHQYANTSDKLLRFICIVPKHGHY